MADLPVRKRLFYGMGGLTMCLPDFIVMQWLLVRYVPPDASKHLVPAALFGVVVLVGRLTEGLLSPVIGHWSDQCRSRWGRRLPFIRFGLVPFVVAFFFLFHPPVGHMHWGNAVYAFALIPIYAFLYGCNITPYLALLPEITTDLKERVDLTTFQSVFIMIGTFVFAGMGAIVERWGWTAFAGTAAVLTLVFFVPVATMIQERPRPEQAHQEKLRLFHSIRLALENRPFRFVMGCTAIYWFGLNGVIALVPHWVLNVLGRTEGNVPLLMVPFLLMNLVFFFVFNALAAKAGKYVLMLVTFLVSGVVIAGLGLVGHMPFGSAFAQTGLILALFGAPAAGFMVLPFAVLSDVVDYDEQLTGRRREAIFFGVQGIAQKAMIGLSVLAFTVVPYIRSDGTKMLPEKGAIGFSGVYRPQDGGPPQEGRAQTSIEEPEPATIRVDANPDSLDAPWRLSGPDGFVYNGSGDQVLEGLTPGPYVIDWGNVAGHITPNPERTATPFGLKLMALLCGVACVAAFVFFIKYPLRERDGKVVLVGE